MFEAVKKRLSRSSSPHKMSKRPQPTDPANMLALVEIISKAVSVVNQEYAKANSTVPSLDATSPGVFDTPESLTPELNRAIQTIEAACAQLSFTAAPPGHVMTNKAYQFEESASLQVITEGKVADFLVDKPDGLHVDELAKLSGLESGKLGRILRMLATKHCFSEVDTNVFANNRLSIKLVSSDPVSSLVGHMSGECLRAASFINESLVDPASPNTTGFQHAFGTSAFQWYGPANPHITDRFNKAMIGWGLVTGKGMLPKAYPWSSLAEGTTICDLGGGNGHATLDLIRSFPQLRIVLQDLESVVEEGKKLWSTEYPEAVENKHVSFVPIDFFKETPVPGSDFYYLRHVIHDWPRAECLTILRNVKSAMKPTSRVLIHEFVLQHVARHNVETPGMIQAPEPLLPNFGVGRVRLYQQDLNMMNVLNSKERTLQEFIELGNEAGLKFVKVWEAGEASLVEFATT